MKIGIAMFATASLALAAASALAQSDDSDDEAAFAACAVDSQRPNESKYREAYPAYRR